MDYNLALEINSEYHECRLNRAYAFERTGQFKNALRDVDYLLETAPDTAFYHFYKGIILSKLRSYDSSLSSFQKAISLGPVDTEAMINIGTLHYFLQQYDSAQYYLDKAFQINPKQPNGYNTLSQILLAKGDHVGSLFAIEKALELVPREPYFLNNRGLVYLEMDSLERGLADINQSIVLNPDNGWVYRNKGIYHLKKGNLKRSLELFIRAQGSKEFIDELYYYFGLVYQQMGDDKKACEMWETGVNNGELRCTEKLNNCS